MGAPQPLARRAVGCPPARRGHRACAARTSAQARARLPRSIAPRASPAGGGPAAGSIAARRWPWCSSTSACRRRTGSRWRTGWPSGSAEARAVLMAARDGRLRRSAAREQAFGLYREARCPRRRPPGRSRLTLGGRGPARPCRRVAPVRGGAGPGSEPRRRARSPGRGAVRARRAGRARRPARADRRAPAAPPPLRPAGQVAEGVARRRCGSI